MPSGTTTKQTMTHYRAWLIGLFPIQSKQLSHPERRQANDMGRFGWADLVNGVFIITKAGEAKLAEANKRDGFADARRLT